MHLRRRAGTDLLGLVFLSHEASILTNGSGNSVRACDSCWTCCLAAILSIDRECPSKLRVLAERCWGALANGYGTGTMANNDSGLGLIGGILAAVLVVLGIFLVFNYRGKDINVNVEAPKVQTPAAPEAPVKTD
jgi:hypothetical protein